MQENKQVPAWIHSSETPACKHGQALPCRQSSRRSPRAGCPACRELTREDRLTPSQRPQCCPLQRGGGRICRHLSHQQVKTLRKCLSEEMEIQRRVWGGFAKVGKEPAGQEQRPSPKKPGNPHRGKHPRYRALREAGPSLVSCATRPRSRRLAGAICRELGARRQHTVCSGTFCAAGVLPVGQTASVPGSWSCYRLDF